MGFFYGMFFSRRFKIMKLHKIKTKSKNTKVNIAYKKLFIFCFYSCSIVSSDDNKYRSNNYLLSFKKIAKSEKWEVSHIIESFVSSNKFIYKFLYYLHKI